MNTQWIQAGLGLWILLSPWIFGFSVISLAKWSSVFAGTAIFLINIWALFVPQKEARK